MAVLPRMGPFVVYSQIRPFCRSATLYLGDLLRVRWPEQKCCERCSNYFVLRTPECRDKLSRAVGSIAKQHLANIISHLAPAVWIPNIGTKKSFVYRSAKYVLPEPKANQLLRGWVATGSSAPKCHAILDELSARPCRPRRTQRIGSPEKPVNY